MRSISAIGFMLGAAVCFLGLVRGAVAQQKPELVIQTGHSSRINAVAWSPDGRLIASGGVDKTVRLWDLESGLELRSLQGHGAAIQTLTFSPDGRTLATAGSDQQIKLWEIASGRELRTLAGHEQTVTSLTFSADGRWLVSGASDQTIRVWDPTTGRLLRTIVTDDGEDFRGWVLMSLSADGRQLASGGKTTKVWDPATGKLLRTLRARSAPGAAPDMSITFSPDGRTLAICGRTLSLLDADTGRTLWTTELGARGDFDSLTFSPDGKSLIGAGAEIVLWDAATGKELRKLASLTDTARVALSRDGSRLVVGGGSTRDFSLRVLDAGSGEELRRLVGHTSPVTSVAFSADGRMLASGRDTNISRNDTIKLWDLVNGQMLRTLNGNRRQVNDVAFSGDGRTLASGGGIEIKLWDAATGRLVRELDDNGGQVDVLAFSADGRRLASGERNGTIRLWDAATGQRIRELPGHERAIGSLAFSPDGRTLASGGRDNLVRLWDAATGAPLRALKGHDNSITALAYSADGRLLASSGLYQQVLLWDAHTGALLRTFPTYTGATSFSVDSLAFSPDGKLLTGAVAPMLSQVGGALLWDVATGALRSKLAGSTSVSSVAFSADGRFIAGGSGDTTMRLWDAQSGQLVASLLSLDQQDWLVVTPDGLFDGSPAAWSQILWRFSPQLYDVAPVEQFFNEYYYPGLLAEIFGGQRPRAAANIEQRDRRQPQLKLSAANAPAGATSARRVSVKVDITAAPAGAQDVRVFRNGSLVKAWHGDVLKGQTRATLEADIPITAGENRLTAYAFNRDNVKSTDAALTITGAPSLVRAGTAYLLAVGINHYANPQFDLSFAVADEQDFAAEFRAQQATLKRYERIELTELADHRATKDGILQALTRIAAQAQPEDAVVVYYAGHGTAEDKQFYLIPHDLGFNGDRDKLDEKSVKAVLAHSISDRELEHTFEGLNAGQILLVIDACNSGQALEASEKRRGPMNSKGLAQLAYEKGMYVLAAAQSYQAAIEPEDLKHGLLTYTLVEEGLKRSAADVAPKDGTILLREWLDFATERVPQLQVQRMRQAGSRNVALAYVEGEERLSDAERRNVQRPRAFYRRELESQPFVILGAADGK